MRISIFALLVPISVFAEEAPCPDYNPIDDGHELKSNDGNILTNTFKEGRDAGFLLGAKLKDFFYDVFENCVVIERAADRATDSDGMNIGGMGYGIKVATNEHPFDVDRFNQIVWALPTVAGCTYGMYVTYASGEKRAAKLTIDGRVYNKSILPNSTGGFCPKNQKMVKVTTFRAEKNETIVRISRDKPLPNIRSIKLEPP